MVVNKDIKKIITNVGVGFCRSIKSAIKCTMEIEELNCRFISMFPRSEHEEVKKILPLLKEKTFGIEWLIEKRATGKTWQEIKTLLQEND